MSDSLFTDEVPDGLFTEDVDGPPEDDGHLRLTMVVGDESESFRLAERVGVMPLMQFARIAKRGARANDMDAMSAMLDFIEQAIHPDDLDAFTEFTTVTRCDTEELLGFVRLAIREISGRPTQPRSSSRGGSRTTIVSSPDVSSSPVSLPGGKIPGPIMSDPRVMEFRSLAVAV